MPRALLGGSGSRFALAALLIGATALFLHARGRNEVFPPRLPLQSFPLQLGPWAGTDQQIPAEVLDVLGPGEFLLRNYQTPDVGVPMTNLYIAYFPSQRTGDTIHSPKNCLPGAGWTPVENQRIALTLPGRAPFPVTRYVIARAGARQLVLYWYWAHNRGVASEYWAKFYLVKDAIALNRTDGALVRITTPMFSGETSEAAQQRIASFTEAVVPLLNDYIPQ
jgi:EpsI family protein